MRSLVHEMRNQLAIATATIEAFLDGKLEPNEKRLTSVLQALSAIDVLIEDIPSVASSASLVPGVAMEIERKPINLCQLIDVAVEAMHASMAEKSISLHHEVCGYVNPECALFMGDAVRIRQILQNVMLNAIAYTPVGGNISIDCHREDGGLEISIRDTGPGLSELDLEHVFEPGYRGSAAADVPGSGFGLSIVKRLLDGQGGSIRAERRERGAAFHVRLVDHPLHCDHCAGCP